MLALLVRLVYNMCVSKKETKEYPMTNRERAEKARLTLQYFLSIVPNDDDVEILARDLLADMLHLLDQEGIDFESVMESAADHFQSEKQGL